MPDIFNMILRMSCAGGIIIILLFAAQKIIKNRFNAKWYYYAGFIALFFMLIPINSNFLPFSENIKLTIPVRQLVAEDTENIANEIYDVAVGFDNQYDTDNSYIAAVPHSYPENIGEVQEQPPVSKTEFNFFTINNILRITMYIWLLGLIILSVRKILKYIKFKKYLKTGADEIIDAEVCRVFEQSKNELKIKRNVNLYRHNNLPTPLTAGLFNPVIYLPNMPFDTNELKLIFKHELIHIKRYDLWYKFIIMAARIIHWFNPLCFLFERKMDVLCEMSCDEMLAENMDGSERKIYCLTILNTLSETTVELSGIYATMGNNRKQIENRFSNMLNYKKSKIKTIISSFILAAFIIGAGLYAMAINSASRTEIQDNPPVSNLENRLEKLPEESEKSKEPEYYSLENFEEEFKEYIENEKIFYQQFINYTGENWMSISGQAVYTQEMHEQNVTNLESMKEKIFEKLSNGGQVAKFKPSSEYTRFYDTLDESMNLMCGIDKNGKWVLYNTGPGSAGHNINETFDSKDKMLEQARLYLGRALMAGVIDMIQTNDVYRKLYNTDENNENIIVPVKQPEIKEAPTASSDDSMVRFAFSRDYRDSLEYTKFADSTFAQRMNNLSEEENNFIRNCIYAGMIIPVADDIIDMNTFDYDDGSGRMGVILVLENGDIVEFSIIL